MPLVPDPSAFDFEMAIEKLKRHKAPGIDRIAAESIKARGRKIHSEIHKLTNSAWNYEELSEEWKESVILPCYKTDRSNYRGIPLCQLRTEFYPLSCCQVELNMQRKLLGIINADFDAAGQLQIIRIQ